MNAPYIRLPPHSIEAEQSLIGGLLLDNSAWDRIADIVSESDFYRDDHRRIFGHIRKLVEMARPADVVTVFESIEKSNQVDQTGGLAYLGEIANATPSAANIRRYAEIVADRALRRKLILASGCIEASAYGPGTAVDAVDSAQNALMPLMDIGGRGEPKHISEILGRTIDEVERRFDAGTDVFGMATGFIDIDRKLGGMQAGDLIILAGRPSMGKSALALNIAEHIAATERKLVIFFSVEMSDVQLAMRSMASIGGVRINNVRSGQIKTDDEWSGISKAMGDLHDAPLWIDSSSGLSVAQMFARCRRLARQDGNPALVAIDYLQLLSGNGNNRNEEIGDITRRLKSMAKELGCPVLVLSQLSRKVEERQNHRPMMSDLRESGSIEQDADVILMMYRDDYYNHDSAYKGMAEVIIVKNRMGETGMVPLAFQSEFSRFRTADHTVFAELHQCSESSKISKRGFG